MADQTPEKSSIFTRIQNSTGYILLLTLFSAVTYIQDIFQDVLVISSSVSSPATYSVISTMKIEEKNDPEISSGPAFILVKLDLPTDPIFIK